MKYGGVPNNLRDKFQQLNPKKSMVSAIEDIFGEWPITYKKEGGGGG